MPGARARRTRPGCTGPAGPRRGTPRRGRPGRSRPCRSPGPGACTLSCARRRTEGGAPPARRGVRIAPAQATGPSRPGIFLVLDPRRPRDAPRARRRPMPRPQRRREPGSRRSCARRTRRSGNTGTAGGGASSTPLAFVVLLAAVGAGGLYVYADYRFDQIKKIHAKHLVRTAPVGQQQPFNMLLVGSDSRAFVGQLDPGQRLRQRGGRRRPAQRRHHGGPLRPRRQDRDRALHPPRPLGRHPGRRQRHLGHEPHQRGLQLGARPPHPDDRAGPGHPDQPLHVGRLPRVLGHGQRAGRRHHGLPDRGQGRTTPASTSPRPAARSSTGPPPCSWCAAGTSTT